MPKTQPNSMGSIVREAVIRAGSFNAEAGTVDVIWSTGVSVERYGYIEALDMSADAVDLSFLNSGRAPVLDAHDRYSTDKIKGVIEKAWLEGSNGIATIRFSPTEDAKDLRGKVEAGIVSNVSVGADVMVWEVDETTSPPTYTAKKWKPFEISFVPVGADSGASVRSHDEQSAPCVFVTKEGASAMKRNQVEGEETQGDDTVETPVQDTPSQEGDAGEVKSEPESAGETPEQKVEQALKTAAEISRLARSHNIKPEVAESMIAKGYTVQKAKSEILDSLARGAKPVSNHVSVNSNTLENPDVARAAMLDSIVARAVNRAPEGAASQFSSCSLMDMAAILIERRTGERFMSRNPAMVYDRVTRDAGAMGTSDFSKLLADASWKIMSGAWEQAQPTYRRFMQKRNFKNFQTHNFLRMGDFPVLQSLNESGELKYGSISEGREQAVLGTYGRGIKITRQALINDSLGAFNDLLLMAGRRVTDFENYTAFALLNQNSGDGPAMADTGRVFNTTAVTTAGGHANKAASGTVIDIANLGKGRAAIQKQKSLDGLVLNLQPRFLLTGPDKATEAEQLTAPVNAVVNSAVNPFSGKLETISDGNISGNGWYLFADPAMSDVYCYGYLEGAEGPQIETKVPFGVGGIEIGVTLDFQVFANDFRGAWFNPGA